MTHEIKPLVPLATEGLEETARALLEGKLPSPGNISGDSGAGSLEEIPADNGSLKTQDNWTAYFNKEKRIMASAYDLYNAGKTGTAQLLESLQKDFTESYVISSTRIIYEPASLESKIIHYHGSSIIAPEEKTIIIPYYNGELIKNALNSREGIAYLQSLFSANDGKEAITSTLKKLLAYPKAKIKIWTPSQSSRKDIPQRAVWLYSVDDVFHVNCDRNVVNVNRSRGVLKSPR